MSTISELAKRRIGAAVLVAGGILTLGSFPTASGGRQVESDPYLPARLDVVDRRATTGLSAGPPVIQQKHPRGLGLRLHPLRWLETPARKGWKHVYVEFVVENASRTHVPRTPYLAVKTARGFTYGAEIVACGACLPGVSSLFVNFPKNAVIGPLVYRAEIPTNAGAFTLVADPTEWRPARLRAGQVASKATLGRLRSQLWAQAARTGRAFTIPRRSRTAYLGVVAGRHDDGDGPVPVQCLRFRHTNLGGEDLRFPGTIAGTGEVQVITRDFTLWDTGITWTDRCGFPELGSEEPLGALAPGATATPFVHVSGGRLNPYPLDLSRAVVVQRVVLDRNERLFIWRASGPRLREPELWLGTFRGDTAIETTGDMTVEMLGLGSGAPGRTVARYEVKSRGCRGTLALLGRVAVTLLMEVKAEAGSCGTRAVLSNPTFAPTFFGFELAFFAADGNPIVGADLLRCASAVRCPSPAGSSKNLHSDAGAGLRLIKNGKLVGVPTGSGLSVRAAVVSAGGRFAAIAALPRNDFVIVLDRRIGPFDYRDQPYSSAYARAVRAFGVPTTRTSDGTICIGAWKRIRLTIAFKIPYCQGRSAGICTAYARERRWRTSRGLGIGDAESRIRRLYRGARLHSSSAGAREWWLVTRSLGELGSYGALSATTRDGRVVEIGIDQACD